MNLINLFKDMKYLGTLHSIENAFQYHLGR